VFNLHAQFEQLRESSTAFILQKDQILRVIDPLAMAKSSH
jgi:hypothetical protein